MGDDKIAADLPSALSTLTKSSKKRLACLALAFLLASCGGGYAEAQSIDHQTLTAIEKRLFQKEYDHDSDEARVARLEKQAFGEASTGDLAERLQHLVTAIAPKKNPDGSISGINPKEVAPQAPSNQSVPQTPESTYVPDARDSSNERGNTPQERAQIAVQAAREESINKLLDQGVQLWRAKRGPQAIEKFEEVRRLDPHNAQANFSMGVVYEASGNLAEASKAYRRAAQEQPDNPEYLQALHAIEKKAGPKQPAPAMQGTLRALAEDAKAAFDRGEFMSALSFYKELDERVPHQALVKYNIGTCYMMTKNPITALEYYKQARKLKPDEPRYIMAVDKLSANLQQAQSAQEQVDRAWADDAQQQQQQPGQQWQQQPGMTGGLAQPPPVGKVKKPKKISQSSGGGDHAKASGDIFASLGLIGKGARGGVVIITVGIASRASHVGLVAGDMIKAVDGTVVNDVSDINKLLAHKPQGAGIQMTVQRGKNLGQVNL